MKLDYRDFEVPFILGGVFASLWGVALFVNMESGEDVARKPGLIEAVEKASLEACTLPGSGGDRALYKARLESVLGNSRSDTLDFFAENKITVCLDARLSFERGKTPAVYYPDAVRPVLAVAVQSTPFQTVDIAATYLQQFKNRFAGAALPPAAMVGHMAMDTIYCGDGCVTFQPRYVWKDAAISEEYKNRPSIAAPPLAPPPPG